MRGVLMKLPSFLPSSCFFLIVFLWTTAAASSSSLNLLGVAPLDVGYYKSGSLLWCKDRSNRFSIDRLNDDFCDCPDGTDEPGTSACTNGRFYCSNQNRMPFWVFSSRVNDGICDCCDGSDEYNGKVRCGHVCCEGGNVPQVVSLSKPLKEFPVRDKMRSSLGEQAENEPPSTMVKSYFLKMLGVLELLLVVIALWQVYRWTFQRGFGLKKRLHRSL